MSAEGAGAPPRPVCVCWAATATSARLNSISRAHSGGMRRPEALAPEAGLARPSRAMVWLAMGDFERGWEEYEWRWKLGDCPPAEFEQPVWSGAPFAARTVLLHTRAGAGRHHPVRPVRALGQATRWTGDSRVPAVARQRFCRRWKGSTRWFRTLAMLRISTITCHS